MTESIKAARNALYAAMETLYDGQVDTQGKPVLVAFGRPGTYQPDYIVALMGTNRPIERPTLGTRRTRRTAAEVYIVVSTYVPGAEVAQQVATDACDDLVELLEEYLRTGPNEELGGACREAWVSQVDGPTPDVVKSKSGGVAGRVAEAVVTVTLSIDY